MKIELDGTKIEQVKTEKENNEIVLKVMSLLTKKKLPSRQS